MKVECPNCKMVSVIKTSRIVTDQQAFELSCPTCDFAMALKLNSSPNPQNHTLSPAERWGILQPATASEQIDAATQHRVMALKAKILRSLVNLPPMPHIILKARKIEAELQE